MTYTQMSSTTQTKKRKLETFHSQSSIIDKTVDKLRIKRRKLLEMEKEMVTELQRNNKFLFTIQIRIENSCKGPSYYGCFSTCDKMMEVIDKCKDNLKPGRIISPSIAPIERFHFSVLKNLDDVSDKFIAKHLN